MKLKRNKGITLIALVITIIVLLIIAGVSIAMLTGENGLLIKAINAKNETNKAGAKEAVQMEVAGSFTNDGTYSKELAKSNLKTNLKIPVEDIKDNSDGSFNVKYKGIELTVKINGKVIEKTIIPGEKVEKTEKNNYTDLLGKKATVPEGFIVVPGCETIDEGLVISDYIEDNELDKNNIIAYGNQFVWIPITNIEDYKVNYNYPSIIGCNPSQYTPYDEVYNDTEYLPKSINPGKDSPENNLEAEKKAVMKYNGFFIGRYETGNKYGSTSLNSIEIICKKSYEPCRGVGTYAKELSKNMYNEDSSVISAICSGIQWDMVMDFVDGKNDGVGKKFNVKNGENDRHRNSIEYTGNNLNDKVQNIYDLEGNCQEYVAERLSRYNPFCVRSTNYPRWTASCRTDRHYNELSSINVGFRIVLYIK